MVGGLFEKKLGNASLNEQLLLMDVPLQRQLNYLH